jgi:hypothetical protein
LTATGVGIILTPVSRKQKGDKMNEYDRAVAMVLDVIIEMVKSDQFHNPTLEELAQRIV